MERSMLSHKNASLAVTAGIAIGLATLPMRANASEPYAPPPAPAVGSAIHGFGDVTFTNDYITPRGLLVTNTGLTTQILNGLVFSLYKGHGLISNVTLTAGIWNDLWSEQNNPKVGSWNEFDWFVGLDFTVARNWNAGVQFVQFLSPPGNFRAESNIQFSLAYDDSNRGWPIAIHPYVKLFYAAAGDSTVVEGKKGDTYDVELGLVPTYIIKHYNRSITLTAPTWITVGPTTYWNDGATGCGPVPTSACAKSNAGVFSTGLAARMPLDFISPAYGNWYIKGGVQYYHIINDSLLLAQTAVGTASSYADAHREVVTGFGSIGFSW
jgi:hypothetical protein